MGNIFHTDSLDSLQLQRIDGHAKRSPQYPISRVFADCCQAEFTRQQRVDFINPEHKGPLYNRVHCKERFFKKSKNLVSAGKIIYNENDILEKFSPSRRLLDTKKEEQKTKAVWKSQYGQKRRKKNGKTR